MKNTFYLLLALLLIRYKGFTQPDADSSLQQIRQAIHNINEKYFQAFAQADSSLLIDCYVHDCWIIPFNAPLLCGPAAPLDFFRAALDVHGVRSGRFISIDIFGNGSGFVTETGFWKTRDANNKELNQGTFLVLWKKTPARSGIHSISDRNE